MAKFKTKVVVLSVEHREENNRIVIFSPVNEEGNANIANSIKMHCKGQKNDNFEEGEIYDMTIETASKAPELTKKEKEAAAKQKAADVKNLNEGIKEKTKQIETAAAEAETLKEEANRLATEEPENEEAIEGIISKVTEKTEEVKVLTNELQILADTLEATK